MSIYQKTTLALGTFKECLVYFDHVIPLDVVFDMLPFDVTGAGSPAPEEFVPEFFTHLSDFLPPSLVDGAFISDLRKVYLTSLFRWRQGLLEWGANWSPMATLDAYHYLKDNHPPLEPDFDYMDDTLLAKLFTSFNLSSYPLYVLPEAMTSTIPTASSDVAITVASLKLIDTKVAPWEQILELRRDADARQKLRRLRLFMHENYADKPRSWIEDDILTKITDYEEAAKKCGFETKASAFTTVLDSGLIAGGIAGSFLSAYLHAPMLTIASAVGATGIAIGKIAVEVSKQQFVLRRMMAENPVSYITYAKQNLGPHE
jgi:hypothetical protein